MSTKPHFSVHATSIAGGPRPRNAGIILFGLWLVLFFGALFSPSVLDDADGTHASAARAILTTGDWVTLRVDGVRYLEKAPLPYWLAAISFKIFGFNAFAAHLPQALAVLLLMLLGYRWANQVFGERTGLYTALAVLTSFGVFLFTRVLIPEVLLSLLLAVSLYALMETLDRVSHVSPLRHGIEAPAISKPSRQLFYPYVMWAALALAALAKGLVALVFFFATASLFLFATDELRSWRKLRPFTGLAVFLAIAAPWHILAGLRNPGGVQGGMSGHGFWWFYFVNEHFLRFLGKRIPADYNKLPCYLYWSLHLVWLFPWSLFLPLGIATLWRRYKASLKLLPRITHQQRTILLLSTFSAVVLLFFSFSTNQEYYTFPAYLPILLLIAATITRAEETFAVDAGIRRLLTFAHAALTVLGAAISMTLFYGLWASRKMSYLADIGSVLAHRGVGAYTLSMSRFFDLTGPSFAALRLPAMLATLAFAVGPGIAWMLRSQRRHIAATSAIACTSAVFLIAAHIALARFGPMLSSEGLAEQIQLLEADRQIAPDTQVMLFGDQAYGSSISFYFGRPVYLVNARSSSMLFGSTFPDCPPVFLTSPQLLAEWGKGPRKLIFVPLETRAKFEALLGRNQIVIAESSGKTLYTDRPPRVSR